MTACGGYVAQLLGDGLLVLFGYPEAQEDSADQAVRAALEIVRVVDDLGRGLSVRVGLHSGPCVVRTVGAGGRHDTVVLGETPNIAARVQAIAEPGEVMVSAATHRLVAGWFVVEDSGAHAIKGLVQPMTMYRVLRPSAVRSRLEARSVRGLAPLVGRDRERKVLVDGWTAAVRGDGQALHLCGEPGIGKSRLALVLRERLAGQPHRWLAGSCTRYVRNTAFHPIVEMVEQSLGFAASDMPTDRVQLVEQGLRAVGLANDEPLALITSLLGPPASELGRVARAESRGAPAANDRPPGRMARGAQWLRTRGVAGRGPALVRPFESRALGPRRRTDRHRSRPARDDVAARVRAGVDIP